MLYVPACIHTLMLQYIYCYILGVQRYAKKRIAIWKTCIGVHTAIHLVSLFLSITAPSSVLGHEIGIYS